MTRTAHHSHEEGFGIVVIALLFTAFAIIMASMLDRNSVQTELARQQQVQSQLSRLNIALVQYARFNGNRFPCPASYLEVPTSATFGAAAAAACKSTEPTPTGTYLAASSNNKLIVGMVPVKELVAYGISYNEAFDPWGARIMYAVHRDLTSTASAGEVSGALSSDRATVTDYINNQALNYSGAAGTTPPDVVLISFGRDRVGGRLRSQASLVSPSIACGVTDRRYLNCDGDRSFIRGPLFTATGASGTSYFDDTVSAIRYF